MGQRGALGIPPFHGPVHRDDCHHLKVSISLVRVVESAEGTGTRGFAADQHALKRQHLRQPVPGVPAGGDFDASTERRGVDAVGLPPAERFREGPENVGGVLSGER